MELEETLEDLVGDYYFFSEAERRLESRNYLGTEVRFSMPITQVYLRLFWKKLSS